MEGKKDGSVELSQNDIESDRKFEGTAKLDPDAENDGCFDVRALEKDGSNGDSMLAEAIEGNRFGKESSTDADEARSTDRSNEKRLECDDGGRNDIVRAADAEVTKFERGSELNEDADWRGSDSDSNSDAGLDDDEYNSEIDEVIAVE